MKSTIDQALQQGVIAHKEGKLIEAENLYRSILNNQPNHPDANHNLGVLAVGVGKAQEALPFFKLALETDPKQEQFWLSYIDTLIKLGQLDDANHLLQLGKTSGLKGDPVDRLESRLSSSVRFNPTPINNRSDPSKQQLDELVALYSQDKLQDAIIQGTTLASQFPDNPKIPNVLGAVYSKLGNAEEASKYYSKAIELNPCLLYTSPSPRDRTRSRMPSSA